MDSGYLEQHTYDGSLEPNDASFESEINAVSSSEDFAEVMPLNEAEDVMGYLDKENATLIIDAVESQKIQLSGKCLMFSQGPDDKLFLNAGPKQIIEYPSTEHAVSQSISESSGNMNILMQCGLNNRQTASNAGIEATRKNDGLQNFDKNEMYVEQEHINSNSNLYSSEALVYHTEEEEEDTTEMVFIPTSEVISLSNNSEYLQLSGVAHPTGVVSKQIKKGGIKCVRKINEESVTVSRAHVDSYSSKMVDEVSAINKENNSSHEHMTFEVETSSPTREENSSVFVPPQDIDHAVSVIHADTSTCDQDGWTKSIQVDKNQAEEINQPDITLPAVTNVTYLERTNLKESLCSEFAENSLIDESRNHSGLKKGTDSSNNDTVNCEASTVKEIIDANESIHLPPELPCENIADDYSKQKDTINCNDLNTTMDFDQSQNQENKLFAPSSKNFENEMAFTNSEESCSEIQISTERTFLSLGDNSDSASSWSKDHNLHILKKSKSVNPSKVKIIDEYNFEDSSSDLGHELNHNTSLDWQSSDKVNSNDISTEVDATKVSSPMNFDCKSETGNLTFKSVLTPITDDAKLKENLADGGHSEFYVNSQYLFDQGPQNEENSSSKILKSTTVKFCKNKQNLALSEVSSNEDTKSDKNILPVKNLNIDNKSKENESIILNIAASFETIVSSLQQTYSREKRTDSAKSLHQTCSRKRKSDSNRNLELFSDDSYSDSESYSTQENFCVDKEKEQIRFDDYGVANEDEYVDLMPSYEKNRIKVKGSHPVDEQTPSSRPETADCCEKNPNPVLDSENVLSACGVNFDHKSRENNSIFSNISTYENTVKPPQHTYGRKKKASSPIRNIELFSDDFFDSEPYSTPKIDNEKEQIIDEYGLADEDGYVNLMASSIRNRVISFPVDESVISLKPDSSDLNLLESDPDLDMDTDIHYGACLMETSFKPTCTEITDGIVPKVSSPVPKEVSLSSSLEERMQTPSCEKISENIDSFKSKQVCDKIIRLTFDKKKFSSIKRKFLENIQRTKGDDALQKFNNLSCSSTSTNRKVGRPIISERTRNIINSMFSDVSEDVSYGFRFISPIPEPVDEPSIQGSNKFPYNCPDCEFVSNKVNNLVAHMKYKACRPSADRIHYMGKRRVHDKLSKRFSKGSIHHQYVASLPTTSEALHEASNRKRNAPLPTSKRLRRRR